MFDIGFSEILVIAVVALIVIGPERLPGVARTLGHLFGRMQRYVNDVKADIQREMELDDLKKLRTEVEESARSIQESVANVEESVAKEVRSAQDELRSLEASLDPLTDAGPRTAEAPAAGESTALPAESPPAAGSTPKST